MAILILSSIIPPNVSGAGVRALRTAKEVAKNKPVKLLTRTKNYNLPFPHYIVLPMAQRRGIFYKLIRNFVDLFVLPFMVWNTLRKIEKPQLIHSFSVSWLTINTFIFNRIFWRIPFIIEITLLGSDTPGTKRKWLLYRWLSDYCLRKADKIICISPLLFDHMMELGYSINQLTLIPNSFDPKYEKIIDSNEKKELKMKMGFPNDEFIILTIGHIIKRKGYPFISEIIKHMPNDIKFKLVAVGHFDSKHQKTLMNNIINDLSLVNKAEKILFVGQTDPLPYLQIADMFLFVSEREGFGSAIIEAMASSLTVICKNIEKISTYIIESDHTGVVINSDDPEDFVREIKFLYSNPSERKRIGDNARKSAIKRFSLNEIIKKYQDLYNTILRNND